MGGGFPPKSALGNRTGKEEKVRRENTARLVAHIGVHVATAGCKKRQAAF